MSIYVANDIKNSEPAYNEKYLKTPKEGSQCIWSSVILIDSVYRKYINFYPYVFLEECKYVLKEKRCY